MSFDLGSYNTVAERITEFREKHPDGSLQPVDPSQPFGVVTVADKTFLTYAAAAYRTPDDPRPGIGVAWEQFPGRTNYTRDSELQNVETSAWGRAIVAVLAADTKKGISSQEEVRNRQAERDVDWDNARPVPRPAPEQAALFDEYCKRVAAAEAREALPPIWEQAKADGAAGNLADEHGLRLRQAIGDRDRELSGVPI